MEWLCNRGIFQKAELQSSTGERGLIKYKFDALILEQLRWEIVQRLDNDSSLSINKLAKEAKLSVSTLKKICGDPNYKIRFGTIEKMLEYFGFPDLPALLFAAEVEPIYTEYMETAICYLHAYKSQDLMELGEQKKKLEMLVKKEPKKAEHFIRLLELCVSDEEDRKPSVVSSSMDDAP